MNTGRRALLLAGALGTLAGPALAQGRAAAMPLPVLDQPVTLRVAYFHNPRFELASPPFVQAVLGHARTLARQHLGLDVVFTGSARLEMDLAFLGLPPRELAGMRSAIYDFKGGSSDRKRLVEATRADLESDGTSLASRLAYARPYLVSPREPTDLPGLAEALVDTLLARIRDWQPFLDDTPYNEFLAWLGAARSLSWPWEVILTNQLVASVEYALTSLHSALRGGVTNGLTTQSPASRYGLVSVLSLFPFTNNDPATLALRGGVRASAAESARWAAALLVHELGHQLLHLGHPYGRGACVMSPPQLLQFREWLAGLEARSCALASSPEMTPGAVRFTEIRPATRGLRPSPDRQ